MTVQETSRHSYMTDVLPTLGARQRCVYEELAKIEKGEDLTDAEIASRLVWPINTVVPRRNELVKLGVVGKGSIRRCRVTGREVIAWRVAHESIFKKAPILRYLVDKTIFNVPSHRAQEFLSTYPEAKKL